MRYALCWHLPTVDSWRLSVRKAGARVCGGLCREIVVRHIPRLIGVAVYSVWQELRDYQTMEHTHLLLEHSAREGGCVDFGKAITHMHYHPVSRVICVPRIDEPSVCLRWMGLLSAPFV